ncbi:VOC family protein [Embleya sp. MST-111070]|uniref:VOC family protein n=1 Tax=Embleya sp. MST-111070 TaxID=3398231 RepID=UPI003F73AA22
MAPRIDFTLDCADALLLADFWKTALGYIDEPPPAPFKTRLEWMAHVAPDEEIVGGVITDAAWLCDPDGVGPRLGILTVPEPKTVKNRLHLDIRVPWHPDAAERWARVQAKSAQLVEAGGRVLAEYAGHHVTMADPEGNEFCVAMGPAPVPAAPARN